MIHKSLACRIVGFLFTISVALNIFFWIKILDMGIETSLYKEMVNDYSDGNIENIENAIIDNIQTQKSKPMVNDE